ncbi:MAG: ferritin-like domain-containing protein [Polyangiaceae bacterium]|nr:ferritin-like domain-containing protein [Polyangiaceae bacterium]MBK8942557.1 ferritin-like domain-containing protein [Polyangiaceae bacterium]
MKANRRRARVELWGTTLLAGAGLAVAPFGCGAETSIPCANPQPVEVDGEDIGFVSCDGGWLHRPEVVECTSKLPRADFECADDAGGCVVDADCPGPFGHCVVDGFGGIGCYCATGCVQDSDCGAGQVCMCGDPIGACVQADCATDADCGEELLCSTYVTEPGCGGTAFSCQTPEDECASDSDCLSGEQCSSDGAKKICAPINCAIGRPFVVEGAERLAGTERRTDWGAADLTPDVGGLDLASRAKLASYWTQIGRMEHASIAAFARFALQLLSLGAPPELVSRTHSAMADETRHTRLAFSLASAYGAVEVGPGALAMDGALSDSSVEAVLETVILEGCVGETVAAMEAREALENVSDPALRFVFSEIARDESEHALLAWRTVTWMLESFGDRAARVVQRVMGELRAAAPCSGADEASPEDERLLRLGYVSDVVRGQLRRHAIDGVILRGLASALEGEPSPASVDGGRMTLV